MTTEPKKEEATEVKETAEVATEESRAINAAIDALVASLHGRNVADQRAIAAAMITVGLRHTVLLTAMPRQKFIDFAAGCYDRAVLSLPPVLRDILGVG